MAVSLLLGIFIYSSYFFYKGNQSGNFFFAALVVFVIIHTNIAVSSAENHPVLYLFIQNSTRELIDINTAITIKLLAQLNQLLTEKQRSYLLDRIESLAADFDTLSCDPETLPKPNFN